MSLWHKRAGVSLVEQSALILTLSKLCSLKVLTVLIPSVYLDVDPVNILDPIRLFAFVGNADWAQYRWNIKITLIDCKLNSEIQGV